MSVLLKKGNSSRATIYENWLLKKTPKKVLFEGSTIPVFQTKELNVFARYCHQCHATGFAFPPQFLIGSEKEVIQKMKGLKEKIHFKLSNRLMPPNIDERIQLEQSGDLNTLLKYIDSFKN